MVVAKKVHHYTSVGLSVPCFLQAGIYRTMNHTVVNLFLLSVHLYVISHTVVDKKNYVNQLQDRQKYQRHDKDINY